MNYETAKKQLNIIKELMEESYPDSHTLDTIAKADDLVDRVKDSRFTKAGKEERYNKILQTIYGAVGDMSLADVGRVLGITRERVRQVETTAIKKLKHPRVGRVLKRYTEDDQ